MNYTSEQANLQTDLSIRNESVQRIFNFYKGDLFFVNRRYQRKLIWTVEEKQKFIDSLECVWEYYKLIYRILAFKSSYCATLNVVAAKSGK